MFRGGACAVLPKGNAEMKRRNNFLLLAFAAAITPAHAQTEIWPTKTVRIVVPFTPGGNTDRVARMLAARLTTEFGQQFVVDNRAGAGGRIGSEIVARANPDGHTLAVVPSSFAISAALYRLPYDPVKGIAPISMIVTGPLVMAANQTVKASSLKEFIALLRSDPAAIKYGSTGAGTNFHLAGELFQQMTQTEMIHVPYKGQAAATIDLLSGQIQLMYSGVGTMRPHIKAGKLRGIAVTTSRRSAALPDLPAVSELLPGYLADAWSGMWAPAGTPKEIVSRLNQAIADFLKQPEVQESFRIEGAEAAHTTPEEFARVIAGEIATWSRVVKVGNIKVD